MLQQNHTKENRNQILKHQQNQNKTRTQLQSCHPHASKEQQNPQKKQNTYKLLLYPSTKPQILGSFNHFQRFNYLLVHLILKRLKWTFFTYYKS
jgi:hypothetical protein